MTTANTTWELRFKDSLTSGISGVQKIIDTTEERFNKLGNRLNKFSAIDMMAIDQSAQQVKRGFEDFNKTSMTFESGLAEVEAITGVTGDGLDKLGAKARESALAFGGEATDSLNTYKTILSRLGPDIAKSPEALEKMERNVRTLSKTMNNDAVGSVDALTTAMLQYGVDLSDPIAAQEEMARMMNVMAAGAKEGAAEVPSIAGALKVAGVQAKQSNVSFVETNAVLQSLAAGGKEGAEAGIALRNVLGKMAGEDVLPKEAVGKLHALGVNMNIVSDTSLPLTTRLRELKKAQGDATIMAQMFGTENAAAASIMLNSVDAQDVLQKKIEGTNAAEEQAQVIMNTSAEKKSRMNAVWNDAKIAIGEYTTAMEPYVAAGANSISVMANMKNAHDGYKLAMGGVKTMLGLAENATMLTTAKTLILSGATGVASAAQWAWNAAMTANPIGLVIVGVAALVGVVALCWNKFEGFRNVLFKGWEMLKLFGNTIKTYVVDRFKGLLSGLSGVGKALMHFFKGEWSEAWQTGKQAASDLVGVDAAKNAAKGLINGTPKALAKGQKASDQYTADKKAAAAKENESAVKLGKKPAVAVVDTKGLNLAALNDPTKGKGKAKGEGTTTGSGDNAVGKSITMTLNITNHFGVSGELDIRKVADKVVGLINDRLRDNVISMG
ncbi:phage tail tape measure protein [Flavobacterium sp. LB2P74]|uniref:phage tail tape measure protein n=1 Tax=Flavobacterium sp. LB2P74 TaxID=3401717 RepID=UPI003AAB71A9